MTTTPNSITFYVYALARPVNKDWRIFYIGKGSKRRVFAHEQEARHGRKGHRYNVIRKVWREGGEIQRYILLTTEDEQEAFDYEKEMIALHGRENLCNQTDGGEGVTGLVISAETRGKLSIVSFARWSNPETRARILAARQKAMDDPGYREKHRRITIQRYANPDERHAQSKRMKSRLADPELRMRIGKRLSEVIMSDPEARKKRSQQASAAWSNPEKRERRIAAIRAAQTDEYCARLSSSIKAYSNSTEGRAVKRQAARASAQSRAVFTRTQGEEICRLWATGEYNQCDLATMFGVGRTSIARVLHGEQTNWKDGE
jgi:hypothetical protein